MNHIARVIVMAGFLLPPASANAELTVTPGLTVVNRCSSDIAIAVHYKDRRGNWATTPFNTVRARSSKEAVASSNNAIFYFYAETKSGKQARWAGDKSLAVEGKNYPMREKKLVLDRKNNHFLLDLSCDN